MECDTSLRSLFRLREIKKLPVHASEQLDIAFVVDCTGSMTNYITQAQQSIHNIVTDISRAAYDVRFALIEYRDHPPQEDSFIIRSIPFTNRSRIRGLFCCLFKSLHT